MTEEYFKYLDEDFGEVDGICAVLGYYTEYSGNSLPTFQDNLSVSSSRVKKSKKGQVGT
jgi:hypothetical protein